MDLLSEEEKEEEHAILLSFLRSIPVPPNKFSATEPSIYKPCTKNKHSKPAHITTSTLISERAPSSTEYTSYNTKQKIFLFKVPSELKVSKTEIIIANKAFPHKTTCIQIKDIVQIINHKPNKVSIKHLNKTSTKQKIETIYFNPSEPPSIFTKPTNPPHK